MLSCILSSSQITGSIFPLSYKIVRMNKYCAKTLNAMARQKIASIMTFYKMGLTNVLQSVHGNRMTRRSIAFAGLFTAALKSCDSSSSNSFLRSFIEAVSTVVEAVVQQLIRKEGLYVVYLNKQSQHRPVFQL